VVLRHERELEASTTKRNPLASLLPLEKLGPAPKEPLQEARARKNNLPDCLAAWKERTKLTSGERRARKQSFCC